MLAKIQESERNATLSRFSHIKMWKRAEERAPHKPLLILLEFSRFFRGEPRLVTFKELCPTLSLLLLRYGPPRKSVHPEYPFFRLQNDGVWEVQSDQPLIARQSNTDPLKSELLKKNAMGGFPSDVWEALQRNEGLAQQIVSSVLELNFPDTMHADIRSDLGFDICTPTPERDPEFRQRVLDAYGHECAVCGYNARICGTEFGLEAAHIQWHMRGGTSHPSNGIALCTLHHKALDYGAIGITEENRVLISSQMHGTTGQWFDEFKFQSLRSANRRDWQPSIASIRWHAKEVFRGPAKD
jgi:putative restriction endonuclease